VLDQLPLTANGKVDRVALRARRRTQLERIGERVGPRDRLESQLARIWEELLHVEPGIRDKFFELGGHSLLLVPLLARVEEVTGKRLDVAAVFKAPTIESLAALLRSEVDLSASTPLVAIQPHGSLPPVFFVHPAGGGVAVYFDLARRLGSERPFYALERTHESAEKQIELLAAKYVEAICAVQSDGTYLLGGWSTGGVIAFEMARQLQERGADASLVVLLDSMAPGDYGCDVRDDTLADFAANLGVPLEVLTADIEAIKNYDPPAASIPLLLLRATEEHEEPETVERWRQLSSNNLEVHNVPGDHFTMMRAAHVSALAEILRECFARTEQS
jgi:thioesterase domain-containing protein